MERKSKTAPLDFDAKHTGTEIITWNKITRSKALPKGRVLCTNNIEAGKDQMTHVWTANLKRKKNEVIGEQPFELTGIIGLPDHPGDVYGIDYWAFLPESGIFPNTIIKLVNKRPYTSLAIRIKQ